MCTYWNYSNPSTAKIKSASVPMKNFAGQKHDFISILIPIYAHMMKTWNKNFINKCLHDSCWFHLSFSRLKRPLRCTCIQAFSIMTLIEWLDKDCIESYKESSWEEHKMRRNCFGVVSLWRSSNILDFSFSLP